MGFNIEALGNYIFAKPTEQGADTRFAKVDSQKKQQYLEVLSVGPDVDRCKVGDSVLPYGQEFQAFAFEGEQILVLRNDEVMGRFPNV